MDRDLFDAIEDEEPERVAELVARADIDLSVVDADGRPPLFLAVEYGQVEIARTLLEAGAPVDLGVGSYTPLQASLENGEEDSAMWSLLMKHGADVHEPTWSLGLTLLMRAASVGSLPLIDELLAAGVQLDVRLRDGEGPAAVFAAGAGHIEVFERLLNCPVTRDETIASVPEGAHRYRDVLGGDAVSNLYKQLLEGLAGVGEGGSLLRVARAHPDLLKEPMQAQRVMAAALRNNHIDVAALLERELKLSVEGMSVDALVYAARLASNHTGSVVALRWIVERSTGPLPLEAWRAVMGTGDIALVEALQERAGGIEASDHRGQRPIHTAAAAHDAAIVKWLIAHGADVDARDRHERSAIAYAKQRPASDAARRLIRELADAGCHDMEWIPDNKLPPLPQPLTTTDRVKLVAFVLLLVIIAVGLGIVRWADNQLNEVPTHNAH